MQMSKKGLVYNIEIYQGADGWTAECRSETGEAEYYTRPRDRELVSVLYKLGFRKIKAGVKCTVCGKGLINGNKAYGLTSGFIDEYTGGFRATDAERWHTVACEACGLNIAEAISGFQKEA